MSPTFSKSDSELEETTMKNRYTNILPCKLRKQNTVYALSSPFVFVTRP
jgi:protein tyrosine phosphatase